MQKLLLIFFLGVLVAGLEEEYEIAIANYFHIFKQARVSRTGRNPKIDKSIAITAYTTVSF